MTRNIAIYGKLNSIFSLHTVKKIGLCLQLLWDDGWYANITTKHHRNRSLSISFLLSSTGSYINLNRCQGIRERDERVYRHIHTQTHPNIHECFFFVAVNEWVFDVYFFLTGSPPPPSMPGVRSDSGRIYI